MKNIIAFIGSLRSDSVNRHVFNHYKKLAESTFNITECEIKDFPLYNQDVKAPAFVDNFASNIRQADGIIFFSPEYNYSIPGGLKNAIDWLSRCENQPFSNKKATIVGASPSGLGTGRMQYHLRQVGVFVNLYFMNKPEVMIGNAYDKVKDGKIIDETTIDFLNTHIKCFNEYLEK